MAGGISVSVAIARQGVSATSREDFTSLNLSFSISRGQPHLRPNNTAETKREGATVLYCIVFLYTYL